MQKSQQAISLQHCNKMLQATCFSPCFLHLFSFLDLATVISSSSTSPRSLSSKSDPGSVEISSWISSRPPTLQSEINWFIIYRSQLSLGCVVAVPSMSSSSGASQRLALSFLMTNLLSTTLLSRAVQIHQGHQAQYRRDFDCLVGITLQVWYRIPTMR